MELHKEKYFYKRYANILTRMKKISKKTYFHHKLEEFKNNPLPKNIEFIQLLCTLLPFNTSSSTSSS